MNQIDFSLNIAHLYPDLLNIYGDFGNILTFKNRCLWRGIDVNVVEIKTGHRINPDEFDFYFIGGGQDQEQKMASEELLKNKERLKKAAESDAVMLAVCGGYQLLGHYYQPMDDKKLEGVSLLDSYTVAGKKRLIGNIFGKCSYIKDNTVVGFENHSGLTYLSGDTKPLLKVIKGYGNNGKDKSEGARYKNVFGTYLHGPVLPKNPIFCDYLISLALKRKYKCEIPLAELNDFIEEKTHDACIKIAGK